MMMNLSPKMLICAVALTCTVQAHADLLPNNSVASDNGSLSARVIDKNLQGLTKNLLSNANGNLSQFAAFQQAQTKAEKNPQKEQGVMERLSEVATSTIKKFTQNGIASWYGRQFHGRPTASGERFDMNAFTAAHKTLPLNCYIRVTNRSNGKSVIVKVNDRGPFHGNRVLDLSYGAAKEIGLIDAGSGNVTIERVDGPNS